MIPNIIDNENLNPDFEEVVGPSKNYALKKNGERIFGFVDGIEAMKQAYYLILSTERYDHEIYSWNSGVEFKDLVGKSVTYVASEVKKRIKDALMQDDRTVDVYNFSVTINKSSVSVTYVAQTIYGEIEGEKEVKF
jgi:hypothetical protein